MTKDERDEAYGVYVLAAGGGKDEPPNRRRVPALLWAAVLGAAHFRSNSEPLGLYEFSERMRAQLRERDREPTAKEEPAAFPFAGAEDRAPTDLLFAEMLASWGAETPRQIGDWERRAARLDLDWGELCERADRRKYVALRAEDSTISDDEHRLVLGAYLKSIVGHYLLGGRADRAKMFADLSPNVPASEHGELRRLIDERAAKHDASLESKPVPRPAVFPSVETGSAEQKSASAPPTFSIESRISLAEIAHRAAENPDFAEFVGGSSSAVFPSVGSKRDRCVETGSAEGNDLGALLADMAAKWGTETASEVQAWKGRAVALGLSWNAVCDCVLHDLDRKKRDASAAVAKRDLGFETGSGRHPTGMSPSEFEAADVVSCIRCGRTVKNRRGVSSPDGSCVPSASSSPVDASDPDPILAAIRAAIEDRGRRLARDGLLPSTDVAPSIRAALIPAVLASNAAVELEERAACVAHIRARVFSRNAPMPLVSALADIDAGLHRRSPAE